MSKYYLIVYDASSKTVSWQQVANFIKYCNQFRRWWGNLPLVWVVESDLSASDIRGILTATMSGTSFIVVEIDRSNLDGVLPRFAWDWFYPEQRPNLLASPQPTFGQSVQDA